MTKISVVERIRSRSRKSLAVAFLAASVSACGSSATLPVATAPAASTPVVAATHPTIVTTASPVATASATPVPAATAVASTSASPTITASPAATASPTASAAPTATPTAQPYASQLAVDNANPSDPNYGQFTLPFGGIGSTSTLSLMPAYAAFTIALDPATCGSGSAAVVTLAQQSADAFTVAGNAAGLCKATITSPSTLPTTIWFTVNITGFSVQ